MSAALPPAAGITLPPARLALNRLAKQKLIASPARGFYVILPPEYGALGCLPADQFIPALMKRLNLSYYTALLSAAQYHGAGHQRPQQFQVFVARNRRPIQCGAVRVAFMARKRRADSACSLGATARIPAGASWFRGKGFGPQGACARTRKAVDRAPAESAAEALPPQQGLEALRQCKGGSGAVIPRDYISARAEA